MDAVAGGDDDGSDCDYFNDTEPWDEHQIRTLLLMFVLSLSLSFNIASIII